MAHIPVLQAEVLEYFNPKSNENFIDCTVGFGGHALEIAEKILPRGKILGLDASEEVIRRLKLKIKNEKLKNNFILVYGNYVNLEEIVKKYKFEHVSGILFDLGLSSWHLEESGRGFSFKKKEPLDMRYNLQSNLTAEKLINYSSKFELENIFQEYGEERKASKIAEIIIQARKSTPIKTTGQLVKITQKAGAKAQRTFQALRIAVNDELNNLKKALPHTIDILKPRGKLVIISFHSLEDRIVKNFFKENFKKGRLSILTKKPVRPLAEEIKINPRSKSAKLRTAIKI